MKNKVSFLVILAVMFSLLSSTTVVAQQADQVATVTVQADAVLVQPQIKGVGYTFTVSGPDDFYLEQEYKSGASFTFSATDKPDGVYQYEIRVISSVVPASYDDAQRGLVTVAKAPVQSGSFAIFDGRFVLPDVAEGSAVEGTRAPLLPNDQVILDDLIVDGSICVGFDCVNGESFGFDTLRLKENNLRIKFQDTSTTGSFPTNDWQITVNDSTNGGANKFSIDDIDGGRTPFTIEASAPSHALYVEDYGRIGFGTSTPAVELEMADGDTPTVRLNQDGSGGWSPQTWDVAGNEANFFIRDVTNSSQLPFRIQPGADSNALTIKSNGYIGVGTWSPEASFHVQRTGENAKIVLHRTDGYKWTIGAGDTLRFKAGTDNAANIDTSGNLTIQGSLTENSDVNLKENFAAVNSREVLAAVAQLPISTWNFKFDDPSLRHLGPMAQDFYRAFGLGADETGIAPLDTNGVALAAIQGLNEILAEKDAQISALQTQNADLEARLTALEQAAPGMPWLAVLPWLLSAILLLAVAGLLGKRLYSAKRSV